MFEKKGGPGFKKETQSATIASIEKKILASPSKHFINTNKALGNSSVNNNINLFQQKQQQLQPQQQQQRSASSPRTPSAPFYEGMYY